jgi:hypothetical protein
MNVAQYKKDIKQFHNRIKYVLKLNRKINNYLSFLFLFYIYLSNNYDFPINIIDSVIIKSFLIFYSVYKIISDIIFYYYNISSYYYIIFEILFFVLYFIDYLLNNSYTFIQFIFLINNTVIMFILLYLYSFILHIKWNYINVFLNKIINLIQ